jgi:succinate dehydrogenase/fumarate reductase flavoprotein subunit
MQVLDAKDEVIPGLYAVGTIVGDMFANYYSFMPAGINLGANCLTFGYIAGREIAGS